MAAALLRQLRRKFLLLVLEVVKLHFDQFMMLQRIVQRGEELWANAVFADLKRRFQPLGLGFECSYLRVGKRKHPSKFRPIRPEREKSLRGG